ERNKSNVIMFDQCFTGILAAAVDQIHNACRNSCLLTRLYEIECRKRYIFAGFDHDSVAADERRDQLPRRDRHREGERSTKAADPDRLPHTHCKLVRHLGRSSKAVKPSALACGVVSAIDRLLNVAARFLA